MGIGHTVALLGLLCTVAGAQTLSLPQSLAPDTRELNSENNYPLQWQSARAQYFFADTEVGAASVSVSSIAFRWDGPTFNAFPARLQFASLNIAIGATARSYAQLTGGFAQNLTQPLTTLSSNINYSFLADPLTMPGPEPWGAANGELRFYAAAPIAIAVPTGGCLVVDLSATGRSSGMMNCLIDFENDDNAMWPGTTRRSGIGCPASPSGTQNASLSVAGQLVPGTSFSLYGTGYAPGGLVVTHMTPTLLPVPLVIPGTSSPPCQFFLDIQTQLVLKTLVAPAGGNIPAWDAASFVDIPASPGLSGGQFFIQNTCLGMPGQNNLLGVSASDYLLVTVGSVRSRAVKGWFAGHHLDANSPSAAICAVGACALRIN